MSWLKWRYNKNEMTWSARTEFCTYTIEAINFTDTYKANCEEDFDREFAKRTSDEVAK